MLTKEENAILTRVTGDAPMGGIMRRHWLPACLSDVLRPGYETSRSACYAAIFNPVARLVASPRCSARI